MRATARTVGKEIRCSDPDCHKLNGRAVGGYLEIQYRFARLWLRVPVDVRRSVEIRCRGCGRAILVPGNFFKLEDIGKSPVEEPTLEHAT